MNFKTTYILFGITVALLAILGIALFLEPVPPEASTYILPSVHKKETELKPEDVDRIEIKRSRPDSETIVFTRSGDDKTWQITEPSPFRADSFAVTGLVREIFDASRDTTADAPTSSLKDYGLEPPAQVITISKGDRSVELDVGDVSPGKENQVVYVTTSDNPKQGVTVKKSKLESIFKKLNDFRDRTLLANSESAIRSVKISEGKKQPVALLRTGEDNWKYTEPPYGATEPDGDSSQNGGNNAPTGVRPLLNDIVGLRVDSSQDFVADNVSDKDLEKYNLDPSKAEVLRIEIQKTGGTKEENKPGDKVVLLVGVSKAVDFRYYAKLEGEKNVVRLVAREVDPLVKLLEDPGALRDRNLVRFDGSKTPDVISIKNSSGTFELVHEDTFKPWQLYRGNEEVKADDKAVQEFISLLTQKNIVRTFPDPKTDLSSLGLDKPSAVVSLWVDGLSKEEEKKDDKKEEKKDDKKEEKKDDSKPAKPKLKDEKNPTVRLSFGKEENNLVAVKREAGGEVALLKVPVNIFERVQNGPLFYIDSTLPKFNDFDASMDVTKLVLIHNGVTTEIIRDTKAKSTETEWKFEKPTDLTGRIADASGVDSILKALNTLHAVKLVSEKAEPEVVDREFGLKTPTLKAIVTLTKDNKPTTYEYEFGKDVGTGQVYARQGQRPNLVFEVDKSSLAPLNKDLQDPTVFHFDAAKVKAVKLIGWKDIAGSPITLEFERKDASTWIAKAPANFNVGSEKLNRLVNGLSSLRAEKFLGRKVTTKEREDNGLTVNSGGLIIEITVEGEKEPYILSVGNLDSDKTAYLATANRLGDALFTVRKDVFEKPKEKPVFFNP